MNESIRMTIPNASRAGPINRFLMALVILSLVSTAVAQGMLDERSIRSDEMKLAVQVPANWSRAGDFYSNQIRLVNRPERAASSLPVTSVVKIFSETRADHADAVARLQIIARGMQAPESAFMEIGGWPAFQHGRVEERPKPSKATGVVDTEMYLLTTVIAAGNQVIRMTGILPSRANDVLIDEARLIGRQMAFDAVADRAKTLKALQQLRSSAAARARNNSHNTPEAASGHGNLNAVLEAFTEHAPLAEGFNQRVLATRFGEVEIAVSPDGQNIVIGRQGDWVASNDGGQTFPAGLSGTVNAFDGGDPSVAYAQSGAFYYAGIDRGCQPADVAGPNGYSCTGMAQSLDNGASFPLVTPAVVCPARPGDIGNNNNPVPGNVGCFPDQEHIAADAWNAGGGGGDQVYSVWRNFDELGAQDPAIVCSQDSGQTWTAPAVVDNPGTASFPRVAVGSDGSVYVAYYDGGNFELRKYSSCATGLVANPIVTVAVRTPVECPFAGHDRCDQNPTSQVVAVDDTNPNHVYYAYGQGAGAGTDNILVRDSLDGGATWPVGRVVQVNAAVPGNRIMPWMCTSEGQAYLTWYDRRAAPANQNDLTDFYGGRVGLDGGGNLTVEEEFRISEVGDPWCASGWPCGTRGAPGASESCFAQPQLAGYCTDGGGNTTNRCDFSDCGGVGNNGGGACQCVAGEVCNGGSSTGTAGGCPKYGDYNGNACVAGRLYASWASATSPPGVPPPNAGSIGILFDFFLIGDVPQIQLPGSLDFGQVCQSGGSATETLQVCNTGNSNLAVNSISSNNSRFTVTAPSGGYPLAISPDFCFPFQVNYDPVTAGDDSAVLTIASNDPAFPEINANLDASVGTASISTFIANNGNFGEVCSGLQADLNLTIQNNGDCDLEIDSIVLSGADASDFELPSGNFAGTIIEPGNSLLVPVRFAPSNFTDPNPRQASVDVASSTRDGASLSLDQTPIEGTVPAPDLNVAIANSGDFGSVCKGETSDLDLTLFNQGRCDLTIDSIVSSNALFVLPADTDYPLVLSHDADFTLPVRYAPQDCDDIPTEATLTINSDSPGENALVVDVSGDSPCPNLVIDAPGLTGAFAFPATVVDTEGTLGCYSERSTNLRNTGGCPLTITDITASDADFTVMDPTQFPIVLPPGEETLAVTVRFTPESGGDPLMPDETLGTLTVDSDDPDASGEADLCGEGVVQSGIRTLVTDITSGLPLIVDSVDSMTVRSKGKKTPSPINLMFTDVEPLNTTVCGNEVNWHLNLETLPATATTGQTGKSQYETYAKEGNLQDSRSFPLGQCEFSEFQLQLKASDGGGSCLLLEKGEACTSAAECCSGKCTGKSGAKTCK